MKKRIESMKFTKEDIETTIDEIKESLHYKTVEYKHDAYFEIRAKCWTEDDFRKARELGLDVQGVRATVNGTVAIDVEWIGKHGIVMG